MFYHGKIKFYKKPISKKKIVTILLKLFVLLLWGSSALHHYFGGEAPFQRRGHEVSHRILKEIGIQVFIQKVWRIWENMILENEDFEEFFWDLNSDLLLSKYFLKMSRNILFVALNPKSTVNTLKVINFLMEWPQ